MSSQRLSVPEAIRARRTVRHYRPDPVPAELLDELLDLAVEAPSAWNMQDRSIVVVTGDEGREGLSWAAGGQPQPREAPVTLVFVADPHAWRAERDDIAGQAIAAGAWNAEFAELFASRAEYHDLAERGLLRENAVKNAMIAATYVMLAAAAMGLATAPMNGWDPDKVKKVIGLGDDLVVAVLVTVGYPAGPVPHPGRLPRSRTVSFERY